MSDSIEIEEYNPRWPELFEQEKQRLEKVFTDGNVIAIEHIGSTAIAGMPAKPVIDILITVRVFIKAKPACVELLKPLEYVYWDKDPKGDTRMFFVKGMPPYGQKRTHHIHIVQQDNKEFTDRLKFRDCLRARPIVAAAYGELKRQLAETFTHDREAYTQAKSDFIHAVMAKI